MTVEYTLQSGPVGLLNIGAPLDGQYLTYLGIWVEQIAQNQHIINV